MDTKDNVLPYNKKTKNIYSIVFLFIVIVITGSLMVYNYMLKDKYMASLQEIKEKEDSIENINKDKDISLYNLVITNKDVLERLKERSNIPLIINHFKEIEKKYSVKLNGFSYSAGNLSSSISIDNNTDSFSYNIAKNFISKYRTDKNNLFDLKFINSIKGNENIKFNVQFTLKK